MRMVFLGEADEAKEMLFIAVLLTVGLLLRTRFFGTSGGSLSEIGQVKMTRINAFYTLLKLKTKSFGGMRWMREMRIGHLPSGWHK